MKRIVENWIMVIAMFLMALALGTFTSLSLRAMKMNNWWSGVFGILAWMFSFGIMINKRIEQLDKRKRRQHV